MKKKSLLALFLLSFFIAFGLLSPTKAEQAGKPSLKEINGVEKVALQFLDTVYETLVPYDYEEVKEKYLLPENELFNQEIFIRHEMMKSILDDFHRDGREVVSYRHDFETPTVTYEAPYYYVEVKFSDTWSLASHPNDSKDPQRSEEGDVFQVVVTLLKQEEKIFVVDLHSPFDGISDRLNKANLSHTVPCISNVAKMSLAQVSDQIPYVNPHQIDGITHFSSEEENVNSSPIDYAAIMATDETLYVTQKKNLDQILKELTQESKMDGKETAKGMADAGMEMPCATAGTPLNPKLAGAWARSYALTSPAEYPQATNYQYIHLESKGAYDCANFASQVIHRGGAPFHDNGYPARSWYVYDHGETMSGPWAYASRLEKHLLNNTGKGPYCTRRTWFNDASVEDNSLYPGDVVFQHLSKNSDAFHTLAISESGGKNRAIYCAHTSAVRSGSLYARIHKNKSLYFRGLNLQYRN